MEIAKKKTGRTTRWSLLVVVSKKLKRTRKKPADTDHGTDRSKLLRIVVGIIVLCVVLSWAVSPIFLENPDSVLALTVNPSSSDCPAGSACFTLELRNSGPWPVGIDVKELRVYPSLIGPSVNVNWLGAGLNKSLVLMPFTGQTYIFRINILGGLQPPDRVYVILTANVTVLYVSHYVVLHSGKR